MAKSKKYHGPSRTISIILELDNYTSLSLGPT